MKKLFSLFLLICLVFSCGNTVLAADAQPPSAYDARDYGLITSVKSQGPFGTCWAHAVCAVAESNMIKKGFADQSVDYSELQLAYFAFQKTDDPLGNYKDEGVYLVGNAVNNTFLSCGGDAGLAGYTLMRGIGLVNESDVPYSSADAVLKNGLDKSYAYDKTVARLTDIYFLSFSNPQKIKQAIIDNGAVCTALNDASTYTDIPCYNPDTGAYFKSGTNGGSQHAVTIVGWDDSYAVSNFLSGHQPTSPGAWLIKDSAGTDWGIDGYWWASYEDVDFCLTSTKKVAVMNFEPASYFDRTYQYDGSSRNSQYGFSAKNIYIANIFTSTADEKLTSVSFSMSAYQDKPYELYIYKNPLPDSPSSGTLVYSSQGTSPGGYMTVPLSEEILLSSGDTFSVIVGYAGDADDEGFIWMDFDVAKNDGYFAYSSFCTLGQSFYTTDFVNYRWTDYASVPTNLSYYGQANFRIKAHTSSLEPSILLGDANGDGVVDSADSVLILKYFSDNSTSLDAGASDVNADGIIDSADAVAVLGIFAGSAA